MGRLNRDTVIALVLLVVWGVFFWQTLLVEDMGYATIGSQIWPQVILVVLFALTGGYLLQSIRKGVAAEVAETEEKQGFFARYRNPFYCFGLFFLFLITLDILGMLIGGVAFVFLALTALGERTPRAALKHAAIAIVSIASMWAIFTFGLHVMLPAGEILRVY